jgi:hypothetical protein
MSNCPQARTAKATTGVSHGGIADQPIFEACDALQKATRVKIVGVQVHLYNQQLYTIHGHSCRGYIPNV